MLHRPALLLRLLAAVLCATLCAACQDDDEPYVPHPEAHPRQTVLMFLPWASDLQWAFDDNVRMVEKNIIANGGLHGQRLLVFRSSSASDASLTEIVYGRGKCYHDTLLTYRDFPPMTTPHVAQVLTDAATLAPAETGAYTLLMGCHGSGWLPPQQAAVRRRMVGGNRAADQMTTEAFAEGIRASGLHLQAIVFDDCYMAGIETAYDLRDVTTWLVGSTCEMMDYGLPYDLLFGHLTATTPRFAEAMAAFETFYGSYRTPCGTLSAIDCREVERTAELMRTINQSHTLQPEALPLIQYFDGMGQHIFYDLGDYVSHLCTDASLAAAMQEQLSCLVPYKAHTPEFYSRYNRERTPIRTFSGITVSDPSPNPWAADAVSTTAWWQATH